MPAALKRIGIGIAEDAEKVLASAEQVSGPFETICYCKPGCIGHKAVNAAVRIVEDPKPEEAMIGDLMAGRISAAVRGTLPSNTTLKALKKAEGVDHLERIALLETAEGKKFLLTPVGVDEGWTVPEKVELINKGRIIAKKFGLPEKTGVLSGGRLGDVGRHKQVDASMADAELVARIAGAEHCEILIEDAIRTCGLIIAPDGISGNLIFRTLTFLGAGFGHGAPVVNISRIFVDTSRASPNYTNALLLAASLSE
ncbi:methanogenesis marker protein Mmp4/MtxX [Methanoregula sp.]|uniref:methanogenesis marker protein Mmp4/MtxX n=1 Tax=Methanoregula sp. TaxID=2052170 RepID=UPI003564E043